MSDGVRKGIRELVVGFAAVVASVATAVGAVLGVLYQTGFWSVRAPSEPAVIVARSAPAAVAASSAQAPESEAKTAPDEPSAPIKPSAAKAPAPIALDGAWRDKAGYCHVLKQNGRKVQVVNFAPVTNAFISAGHGTINGRSLHLHMNNLRPAFANAELYVSDDGHELLGTIHRLDGDHPVEWLHAGPKCE